MLTKELRSNDKDLTGSQSTVTISYGAGELNRNLLSLGTYAQLRAVRRDPTVALARNTVISCIQAGSWSIEADDGVSPPVKDFFNHILKLRQDFVYQCVVHGKIDFGWMGFEKVYEIKDGRIEIRRLKPLLHDITSILVSDRGEFNGLKQSNNSGASVTLEKEKCVHIAFDVEGSNLYGYPLLENVRQANTDWTDCNAGAKRYDSKIAGTHWVVYYPPGNGEVDGETVDNGTIAASILTAMESSGSVAIPSTVAEYVQELNSKEVSDAYAWKVELLSDSGGKQTDFISRLKYLDSLKVRGLMLPERAILEGQFGTKAESATQSDWAVLNMQEIDKQIANALNEQVINPLLELNFGAGYADKVRIVASPLEDLSLDFLRKLYLTVGKQDLDIRVLSERLEIPIKEMDVKSPSLKIDTGEADEENENG